MSKFLGKRGRSPCAAAVVYPDVTEEDVVRAAGMLPGLSVLAGTVCHILSEGRNEMDIAMAKGLESSLHDAMGIRQLGIRTPS